jgi:hypothetical protein
MLTPVEEPMSPNLLIDVTLVCLFCERRSTIHVFRDRHLPEKIYWECFDCQKRKGGFSWKPQKPGARKRGTS